MHCKSEIEAGNVCSSFPRYFTQGVPVVLFTSLPLVLLGVWQSHGTNRTLFWLSLWLVGVHSFLGHKEFRFIFAIVPVASVYSGQ